MTLIKVTQEHINKGKRRSSAFCPVALAISDSTGWESYVHCDQVLVASSDGFRRFRPNAEGRLFILNFDDSRPVYPFTFRLPIDPVAKEPT